MALTLKLFPFSRKTNSTQSRLQPSERVIKRFLRNWACLDLLFNNCCFSEPQMSHTLWLEATCAIVFHKEKQDKVIREHLLRKQHPVCPECAAVSVQREMGSGGSFPFAPGMCGHFVLGLITHLPFLLCRLQTPETPLSYPPVWCLFLRVP